MVAWCRDNTLEKKQAVADGKARIEQLENKVRELGASSARLKVEISLLSAEVEKNQQSVDQAVALRTKQRAQFEAENQDLVNSISAVKSAIEVLSKTKGNGGAFIQLSRDQLPSLASSLKAQLSHQTALLEGTMTPAEQRLLQAFLQRGTGPSSEIFGILKQMQETFEKNLAGTSKSETENQLAHDELKAAKDTEIRAGQSQLEAKQQELANADAAAAQASQDMVDTKNTLGKDTEFLQVLGQKCEQSDKEYKDRKALRGRETEAVTKALEILSSQGAHALLGRSVSLLQEQSAVTHGRRTKAAAVLAAAAKRLNNPQLALLSTTVKLDAFERVKKAIDDMVLALIKQQEDEALKRDYCTAEFAKNEQQTEQKQRAKEDLIARSAGLQASIKQVDSEIAALNHDIDELKAQLKKAGEERESSRKSFAAIIADQRGTQDVLKDAIKVLTDFYAAAPAPAKAAGAGLIQVAVAGEPAGFKEYKNKGESTTVMVLLKQLLEDAKAAEAAAAKSDRDSQAAYEEVVKQTDVGVEAKKMAAADKAKAKAQAEEDVVQTRQSKHGVIQELDQLSDFNAQLHKSCDFVVNNFALRETARNQEVEALKQARAILSNSKATGFLQAA